MKFICDKRAFSSALNITMRAVPSKTTLPILECVCVSAEDGLIRITSNDMEFAINTVTSAIVDAHGSICIDAKILNDIIRKLPDGDVTLETGDNSEVKIKCGKAQFKIPGKDTEQFPDMPNVKGGTMFSIAQPIFRDLVQKTIFCVSQNENNKLMTGEFMKVDDDKLTVVALDGHRVAIKEAQLSVRCETTSVIVPGRSISEVTKILNGGINDMVDIVFAKNHVLFRFDDTIIIIRTLAGEYFDYKKLMKYDATTKLYLDRDELLDCMSRCLVLVREGEKKPVVFDIEKDVANISVTTALGTVTEDIGLENDGSPIKIGFNARFLMEAISAVDDGEIEMRLINPKSPVFITKDDDNYMYVVLPVNL